MFVSKFDFVVDPPFSLDVRHFDKPSLLSEITNVHFGRHFRWVHSHCVTKYQN